MARRTVAQKPQRSTDTGTEAEGTSGTEHIGGGAAAGGVAVGCTGDAVPAVEPSVSPGSESVSYANKWHENYRV